MDAIRYDGLANALTALGDPDVDTRKVTTRSAPVQRTVFELEGEFAESWMANKEVSAIPAAMYRPGFNLTNVKPATLDVSGVQSILEGEQNVGADGQIDQQPGLLWYAWQNTEQGNKLGGSALLVIVDDGLDPIEPLDTRRIQRVVGWEVLDRYEISPWLGSGLNSEPEYYVLTDVLRHSTSALKLQPGHIIHRSRLKINPGKLLSRREMRARGWWGASVLELNWEARRGAEEALQYLLTFMDRASWLHLCIAGLNEILAMKDRDGNPIGESAVRTRMKTIRMCARVFGIVVTDGGKDAVSNPSEQLNLPARPPDKLESVSESVGSLPEIEERARENWRAGWGAPKSISEGAGTNGLRGGDNKADQQTWEGMRRDGLQDGGIDQVNWMLLITFAAKEGPTGGVIPDWTLEPKPLYVATTAEKATEQKLVAEADQVRINSRVVSAREVREQRMVLGDHDGPLRAMEVIEEDQTIQPKAVGVVTGLLDAGAKVFQGEMSSEYMAWVLPVVDPTITQQQALVGAEAARNKALPVANAAITGTVAVGQDQAAGGAEDTVTDEEVGLFSSDPIPAGGLMKAREIKDRLRAEGFLGMTTQRIKKLARDKVIRVWDQLGSEPGFSLQDVVDELQRRNGKPEPEGAEEPDVTEDRADRWWVARADAEPDEATVHAWLIDHYSHRVKLSQPRIKVLLGLRDKYPYLRAPAVDRIYRGLSNVSPAVAGKLARASDPSKDKSWTTSAEQAAKFASGEYIASDGIDEDRVGVIMHGAVEADVLLLDAEAIAKIPVVAEFTHPIWKEPLHDSIVDEREVVVLGPVAVRRVEVMPMAGSPDV